MVETYNNYSLGECDKTLAKYADRIASGHMKFFQKFTCDKCWARITIDEPNKLFIEGHCQECGHVTDLKKRGCNYSLMLSNQHDVKEGPADPSAPQPSSQGQSLTKQEHEHDK